MRWRTFCFVCSRFHFYCPALFIILSGLL